MELDASESAENEGLVEPGEVSGLYRELKEPVWRFILGLARNEHETEDLVQAAFLRLLERVEARAVRRQSARALLFTIAHNLFIDSRRKSKKEVPGAEQLATLTPGAAPDQSHRIQELIRHVCEDESLPERPRAVLRLRIYGQYTLQRIADALGVSRTTAFADLETIIRTLRDVLSDAGITPEDLMR